MIIIILVIIENKIVMMMMMIMIIMVVAFHQVVVRPVAGEPSRWKGHNLPPSSLFRWPPNLLLS